MTALLVIVHTGVAAIWLGAMTYSLLIVQPRARRWLGDPQRYEEFAATIAAGARWKVLGMIAAVALSGAGLALLAVDGGRPDAAWTVLIVAKVALLAVSLGLFWFVSWRLWPRRLFALESELPPLRRRFDLVAVSLTGTVAAAFLLGLLAAHS